MQCFAYLNEVAQAQLSANIRKAVVRSVQSMLDVHGKRYDPVSDGFVVLMDQSTTDEHAMRLFGHTWANAPLEGVNYDRESGTFLTVVLLNNQFALSIIIPDLPWLSPGFRANLMENLCGKERP